MSSIIARLGLPVVDRVLQAGNADHFVLRSRTREDAMNKLKKLAADTPKDRVVCAYHIGMRPDNPILVARYFVEVEIKRSEPGISGDIALGMSPFEV